PTRWRGSREKGGPASGFERTAPPACAWLAEARAALACTGQSLCAGPPGSTRAGQSRRRACSGGARALRKGLGHHARAAGVSRNAWRGHRHVLEGDPELLARLVSLL